MMRTVYIDTIGLQTRRVVVEDGEPVELAISYRGQEAITGNLYLARVHNVARGLDAAFVDIGLEKHAFLPLGDLPPVLRGTDASGAPTAKRPLKGGQQVIVEVLREGVGEKGPRVTMNPSLAGQYVVLLPTVETVGVSRRVPDADARRRLERIGRAVQPTGGGIVLRTAATGAQEDAIVSEARELAARWADMARAAETARAPALLFEAGSLSERTRMDLGVLPQMGPLADALEARLDKLLRRKVWLPGGGTLIIDSTEAMTVIDVNSGRSDVRRDAQEAIRRLNTEAAREIARQLRLRDIGGIVIIDFVDMQTDAAREAVAQALADAMRPDRAKRHIHGFTHSGLLELTRRPVYQALQGARLTPCPVCGGEGCVKDAREAAHTLLRRVRRARAGGDTSAISLVASPSAAAVLAETGLPEGVTVTAGGAYCSPDASHGAPPSDACPKGGNQ